MEFISLFFLSWEITQALIDLSKLKFLYVFVDIYKAIGTEIAPNIAIESVNAIEYANNSDNDGIVNPGEGITLNLTLENQECWQTSTFRCTISTIPRLQNCSVNSAACCS